jgi:predicted  nucleic acid-binding Zn-ribbon protein
MIRKCKDCGQTYDDRFKKTGLITQCESCGEKEERDRKVERYVGRRDGETKTSGIRIYRTDTARVKQLLKRENRAGFNASLPFNPKSNGLEDK